MKIRVVRILSKCLEMRKYKLTFILMDTFGKLYIQFPKLSDSAVNFLPGEKKIPHVHFVERILMNSIEFFLFFRFETAVPT